MKRFGMILALSLFILLLLFTTTALAEENFIIFKPAEDSTSEKILPISGQTEPDSVVVIYLNGEKKEVISVGASGIFATQLELEEGINKIVFKVTFPSGVTKTFSKKVLLINEEQMSANILQLIKAILILK